MSYIQILHKKNLKIDHNEFTMTNSPGTNWHNFGSGLLRSECNSRRGQEECISDFKQFAFTHMPGFM